MLYVLNKFPRLVAFCEHECPTDKVGQIFFMDRFIKLDRAFIYYNSDISLKCIHKLINEHYLSNRGIIPYFGKIIYYSLQLYEGMNESELMIFSTNGKIRLEYEPYLRKKPLFPDRYNSN